MGRTFLPHPESLGRGMPLKASLNVLQAGAQDRGDWSDTRDGSSHALFCTLSPHTPLPTITHNCQTRGGRMAQGWLTGGSQ